MGERWGVYAHDCRRRLASVQGIAEVASSQVRTVAPNVSTRPLLMALKTVERARSGPVYRACGARDTSAGSRALQTSSCWHERGCNAAGSGAFLCDDGTCGRRRHCPHHLRCRCWQRCAYCYSSPGQAQVPTSPGMKHAGTADTRKGLSLSAPGTCGR
jgi:hypothetical protein